MSFPKCGLLFIFKNDGEIKHLNSFLYLKNWTLEYEGKKLV